MAGAAAWLGEWWSVTQRACTGILVKPDLHKPDFYKPEKFEATERFTRDLPSLNRIPDDLLSYKPDAVRAPNPTGACDKPDKHKRQCSIPVHYYATMPKNDKEKHKKRAVSQEEKSGFLTRRTNTQNGSRLSLLQCSKKVWR